MKSAAGGGAFPWLNHVHGLPGCPLWDMCPAELCVPLRGQQVPFRGRGEEGSKGPMLPLPVQHTEALERHI